MVFPIISVVCALIGVIWIAYSLWLVIYWPSRSATIVGYEFERGEEGKFFHPVFQFQRTDGVTVTKKSNWGSWRRIWAEGTRVRIYVHPTDETRTEIRCFANLFGPPAILFGLAAFIAVFQSCLR